MTKKRSGSSARVARARKSEKRTSAEAIDFSDIPEATDAELTRARRVGRPRTGKAKQRNRSARLAVAPRPATPAGGKTGQALPNLDPRSAGKGGWPQSSVSCLPEELPLKSLRGIRSIDPFHRRRYPPIFQTLHLARDLRFRRRHHDRVVRLFHLWQPRCRALPEILSAWQ